LCKILFNRVHRRTGKNSYKFSGLANLSKNVGIVEQDGAVSIQVPCNKHSYKTHRFAVKKNARRSAHAAGSVAKKIRPDLEKLAKAKAGAISRGIRTRNAVAQN
jgi:hypothetical protein